MDFIHYFIILLSKRYVSADKVFTQVPIHVLRCSFNTYCLLYDNRRVTLLEYISFTTYNAGFTHSLG